MRIRVIMPAIIDQAGRPFNADEADGVNRRHRTHREVPFAPGAAGRPQTRLAVGCHHS